MPRKPTRKELNSRTKVGLRRAVGKVEKDKGTEEMLDLIQVVHPGFDPLFNMVKLAKEFYDNGDRKAAFEVNKEISSYIYSKKRSVEHTGNKKEDPIQVNIINYSGSKPDAVEAEVVVQPRTTSDEDDSES